MTYIVGREQLFETLPNALYAADNVIQEINKPSGPNLIESKGYSRENHKMYSFKIEVSVMPNGICTCFTSYEPGSVSDIALFMKNIAWYLSVT